jgi:hypothetical protein
VVWVYRKATWAIEQTPEDLGLPCRQMAVHGMESIDKARA